eukprot:749276-Hanusia_phi.AAC.1
MAWAGRTGLAAVAVAAMMVSLLCLLMPRTAPEALAQGADMRKKLIEKLDSLLLKREGDGDSPRAAKLQRAEEKASASSLKLSKHQSEMNSCKDGGPCNANQMPVLKYDPASGNWDYESAGNPNFVWQQLMKEAKTRDGSLKNRGRALSADPARFSELAQVSSKPSDRAERLKLQDELKMLLEEKLTKDRASTQAHNAIMASATSSGVTDDSSSTSRDSIINSISTLNSEIERGEHLGKHGTEQDEAQMRSLYAKLGKHLQVGSMCRRRHLAQSGLHVLRYSSLASCERQIRYRTSRARKILKAGLNRLARKDAAHLFGGGMKEGYRGLQANKDKLSTELTAMEREHSKLQAELARQKERITQLSSKATAHAGRSSPPVPDTKNISPPVPAGLPPNYHGKLLRSADTDTPNSVPPGLA